ncbi:MAG TPA: response regulator [Novosphingobium sp.]|nr:response regulator [Novosphingobium sp.]
MPLGTQIAQSLPFLRRYARALTGAQQHGDRLVAATLEKALADPALRGTLAAGGRVALYHAFSALFEQSCRDGCLPDIAAPGPQLRLSHVPPRGRQALLLTTLEDFSDEEAGAIMGLSPAGVRDAVAEALADIARTTATEVLVIEDEPLIAMQLELLVEAMGHSLVGSAATRGQAQAIVAQRRPGLVLADIQLADGSSGLDAVEDILAIVDVPVIVITAFPERLLTGDRPEPAFLITKPFREETVRAAIAQALFFHEPAAA